MEEDFILLLLDLRGPYSSLSGFKRIIIQEYFSGTFKGNPCKKLRAKETLLSWTASGLQLIVEPVRRPVAPEPPWRVQKVEPSDSFSPKP